MSQDASTKMVERVAAILILLGAGDERGASLAEICEATDLKKATAHRLLSALVDSGLCFQDVMTRNYRLGLASAGLGRSAREQSVAGAARASLQRLARLSGDTAFVSIPEGSAAVCVAREIGEFPIRTLTLSVGDRRPLGVGAGSLALLASLPDAMVERVLARNVLWLQDFQGFDPASLRALVAKTRADGFALNAGRIVPGMSAISLPVLDENDAPIAALSIAAIESRMSAERLGDLAGLLRREAVLLRPLLSGSRAGGRPAINDSIQTATSESRSGVMR